MRTLRSALAGLLALIIGLSPVIAQLPNIQDNAVWGRIGSRAADGGSGPSQAIPFVTLLNQLTAIGLLGTRQALTSSRTYFWRSDGNDACDGLTNAANSSGSCAFLTAAHALTIITSTLDFAGHTVTLQNGNGATYTSEIFINNAWVGGGQLIVDLGGGGISAGLGFKAFLAFITQPGNITVQNGTLATTGFSCLQNAGLGTLIVGPNLTFGNCNEYQLEATSQGAFIAANANPFTIAAGSGGGMAGARSGGQIFLTGSTINFTGDVTYSSGFVHADDTGVISAGGNTFNLNGHAVTGQKFSVTQGGVIDTLSSGVGYFPGSLPGYTGTNGVYDSWVGGGVGNTNYQMQPADRYLFTTVAFTVPRTWTLPAAGTVDKGQIIWVVDAKQTVTPTNTLTIAPSGADTINGAGSLAPIANAGVGIPFASDGVSNWSAPSEFIVGAGVVAGLGHAANSAGGFPLYGFGSWTPTVTTAGTPGTPAYTTQVGSYEQVGRQVTLRFQVVLSGWTGSPTGNVSIGGLPAASANVAGDDGACFVSTYAVAGLAASNIGIGGIINPNTSAITLVQNANAGSSGITAAQFGAAAQVVGFCSYRAS